ncbi:MAG: aminotransferase DegT [Vicingaceae bacterium]|nr:MAG: aminotransferase DegT [Bacteroidia bacterium]GIV41812.1 MAG: aminotransferase DegT [Vicingaceae bacterium]
MQNNQNLLPVTQSFLPPIEEYIYWVSKAFDNRWLTNRGELVKLLEEKIKQLFHLDHLLLTTNGTLPLQMAVKLLPPGEIITTPFSYVATTAAIAWENHVPVFADIEHHYFTIDPYEVIKKITPSTVAILATHVYGNVCDLEALETIAKENNLVLIYDAAHAFGVNYKGKNIFRYGDISTCSFHATKLFHTGEGGSIVCNRENWRQVLFDLHNFGHKGPIEFSGIGINAKMSELQAAMGLAVFPYIDKIIGKRKQVVENYTSLLTNTSLQLINIRPGTQWNYAYFPVVFPSEESLLKAEQKLKENHILPRRYFYPSLNKLPYVTYEKMPVAEDISSRVLCLPLSTEVTNEQIEKITSIIKKCL